MPMATKFGMVVTDFAKLPPTKLHNTLNIWSCEAMQ